MATACGFVLAACGPLLKDKQAELESQRAAIRSEGYPVTQNELVTWHGSVPEGENGFPTYLDAMLRYKAIDPDCDALEAIDRYLTDANRFAPYPADWVERAVGYYDQCAPVLKGITSADTMPHFFVTPGSFDEKVPQPQLHGFLTRYAAAAGDDAALLESQQTTLRIASALLTTPDTEAQTAGGRYLGIASNALMDVLNRYQLPETLLSRLQASYNIVFHDPLVNAILASVCTTTDPAILQSSLPVLQEHDKEWSDLLSKTRESDPAIRTVAFVAGHAARCRIVVTTLAIERFRANHASIPDSLGSVVPAYLPSVPPDPFDGRPLRYYKSDQTYEVYSVYTNGGSGLDPDGNRIHIPGTIDAMIRRPD